MHVSNRVLKVSPTVCRGGTGAGGRLDSPRRTAAAVLGPCPPTAAVLAQILARSPDFSVCEFALELLHELFGQCLWLPEGKDTVVVPARDQVDVIVKHLLASGSTVTLDDVDPIGGQFLAHYPRHTLRGTCCGNQIGIAQRIDVSDFGLADNQGVAG